METELGCILCHSPAKTDPWGLCDDCQHGFDESLAWLVGEAIFLSLLTMAFSLSTVIGRVVLAVVGLCTLTVVFESGAKPFYRQAAVLLKYRGAAFLGKYLLFFTCALGLPAIVGFIVLLRTDHLLLSYVNFSIQETGQMDSRHGSDFVLFSLIKSLFDFLLLLALPGVIIGGFTNFYLSLFLPRTLTRMGLERFIPPSNRDLKPRRK